MPLTDDQAFKVGFLYKCAQLGLTIDETHDRIKQAISTIKSRQKTASVPWWAFPFAYMGGKAMELGGQVAGAIPGAASLAATGAIAAPVLAGGAGGYLAAKATTGDGKSLVDDAKQDEIVGEYERLADEARRRAKIKKIQDLTGRHIVALSPTPVSATG